MPRLAKLASSSRVEDHIDPAAFKKWNHLGHKRRPKADTKAAVSMDHRSISAVALEVSFMKQEHRYPRLVTRFNPRLFELKQRRIKWHFVFTKQCVLQCFEIHAIDSSGHQERRKRNQQLFRLWFRAQRIDTADAGQFDMFDELSLQVIHAQA